ncbi:uncharacterized protein N0V89_004742 [Didymosphaeria variabile]|uniref:Uncharacterized protein n=1 Tax=Didymosphaeria variabile TaxID=1932322 RepID=A0A9W8XSE2_9PLEO|nr:uncharacterized protein N0V89_004742 [Didymosphaeria variabile]KAJ4356706.1 hypothetical protein N0V89_004742 [Didymosphaeria variabile]
MTAFLRPATLLPTLNLFALASSTFYLRTRIDRNLEEQEARLDELEGTLRGHIGLIEDALDRIEGKKDRGRQEAMYGGRGRNGKEKEKEKD